MNSENLATQIVRKFLKDICEQPECFVDFCPQSTEETCGVHLNRVKTRFQSWGEYIARRKDTNMQCIFHEL